MLSCFICRIYALVGRKNELIVRLQSFMDDLVYINKECTADDHRDAPQEGAEGAGTGEMQCDKENIVTAGNHKQFNVQYSESNEILSDLL